MKAADERIYRLAEEVHAELRRKEHLDIIQPAAGLHKVRRASEIPSSPQLQDTPQFPNPRLPQSIENEPKKPEIAKVEILDLPKNAIRSLERKDGSEFTFDRLAFTDVAPDKSGISEVDSKHDSESNRENSESSKSTVRLEDNKYLFVQEDTVKSLKEKAITPITKAGNLFQTNNTINSKRKNELDQICIAVYDEHDKLMHYEENLKSARSKNTGRTERRKALCFDCVDIDLAPPNENTPNVRKDITELLQLLHKSEAERKVFFIYKSIKGSK